MIQFKVTNDTVGMQVSSTVIYQGPQGEQGPMGPQGPAGPMGPTGVSGVYIGTEEPTNPDVGVWIKTDGRVEQVYLDYIAQEQAKRDQLKPGFANSVAELEEHGDPAGLYVLPDGMIYAYMDTTSAAYTNQIALSVDENNTPYSNGTGWKPGYRLNSSGTESESSADGVTGFIPVKYGDVVRFKNFPYTPGADATGYIALYNKNFESIASTQSKRFDADDYLYRPYTVDAETGYITSVTLASEYEDPGYAYIRISAPGLNGTAIITVNEEILNISGHIWQSTGHAFVPADYEGRIIAVEKAVGTQDARLQALEHRANDSIPDYVVNEAEDVIDRVIAVQAGQTFTFAAITDLHYGNNGNKAGVEHACQAIKYIGKRIKLDAVAVLGDYTIGGPANEADNAIRDFKAANSVLDELRFSPNLRLQGNHDYYADNLPITHRFIQAYSENVVWGDRLGGYFYKDFADHKLRIICLNTAETGTENISSSAAQYAWFAEALDLSGKPDTEIWHILVLSHHPVDWWYADGSYAFSHILNAYKTGKSWLGGGISCDFSGKNTAQLVGNIHGHIHNLLTDKIYAGNTETADTPQYDISRLCTPEACIGRENQYSGVWAEDISYEKLAGTAEETAFCIYCINLDARTVKAICYGAGYDRQISY